MGSSQKVQEQDRMEGTKLWRWPHLLLLLLLLYVSGSHAINIREEQECLIEGENLTVTCPYNIMKYASSPKAWQRVRSQGLPETLLQVETRNIEVKRVQAGRYLLEDIPYEAVMKVTVTGLQRQDEGLYQCVISSPPQDLILHVRIRLVHCSGPSDSGNLKNNPTQALVETTTLPLVISMNPQKPYPMSRTVPPLKPTAIISSPGLSINSTNVRGVIRVSIFSIVVPVVCGILGKSLVFSILLVVTRRSTNH
ncbi:PREDICTED: triggering receptor expressed on myeloid cells 1-like [Chrysochloris asiatica]|uniref:Triggering receptor expressed on myeloid cells 1-like n=1 Tax=Chrysochloris asiatica TaxID=185453 RepID=A0A9B0TH86_CHRAS|nr:PREDICTED: triggering receptor expressed on myeloid cells 1-like [Chrysochloris asiatica]